MQQIKEKVPTTAATVISTSENNSHLQDTIDLESCKEAVRSLEDIYGDLFDSSLKTRCILNDLSADYFFHSVEYMRKEDWRLLCYYEEAQTKVSIAEDYAKQIDDLLPKLYEVFSSLNKVIYFADHGNESQEDLT